MFDTPSSEVDDSSYEVVSEGEKKKYVCTFRGCNKFFRYKSEIVRHTATHSESRPFICQYDNCFKAFKRNDALENHIRSSHTKETPFVCPHEGCGMRFTTHGSFRYHVLKHNKQGSEHEPYDFSEDTAEDLSQFQKKQVKLDLLVTDQSYKNQISLVAKKLGNDDLSDEFFAPPPRFASGLKWEMVDDEFDAANIPTKVEESQKPKLDSILEENAALKQRLGTSEGMVKNMQKQIDDLMETLYSYQSQLAVPTTINNSQGFSPRHFSPQVESQFEDKGKTDIFSLDLLNYRDMASSPEPLLRNESSSFESFPMFGRAMNSLDY